jgi:hypothetical protein
VEGGQRSRRGRDSPQRRRGRKVGGLKFGRRVSHASCKCSAVRVGQPYLCSLVTVPLTQPVTRFKTRCHVAGRRYFAEPPLDGLKPGSPGGSPYRSLSEDMSHEPHPSAKTCGRRSRRNEADAPNPVPLIPPRFEHENEHDDEDDLVADLGVSSVERSAAPCLCGESLPLRDLCGFRLSVPQQWQILCTHINDCRWVMRLFQVSSWS